MLRSCALSPRKGKGQMVWCRTRVTDSAFYSAVRSEETPIKQLVVVGAGYDTRAYRFRRILAERSIRCFELDLPSLQPKKVAAMKRIAKSSAEDLGLSNVTFVPVDLSEPKPRLHELVTAYGLDSSLASFFVWEGVVHYLPRSAVVSSLEFMHECSAAGSQLIVEFATPEITHMPGYKAMKCMLELKREPHLFYTSVEDMTQLMRDAGWEIVELYSPERLSNEFLNEGEGQIRGGIYLALAKRMSK
jgi:methyltransferase (TIGR00027 family)